MICPQCKDHMMVVARDRTGKPVAWYCWWDTIKARLDLNRVSSIGECRATHRAILAKRELRS
jgi:hypothetical protein